MEIIPFYKKTNTEWSLTNYDLSIIYYKILEQRLLKTLFYDGSILSTQAFIDKMKDPGVRLFLGFHEGEIALLSFLTTFDQRTAQGHFTSLKIKSEIDIVKEGKYFVNQLLNMKREDTYYFDTFYGIVPVTNKLAIRFSERCGMTKAGIIPKFCFNYFEQKSVDGQILYIVRGENDENIQ